MWRGLAARGGESRRSRGRSIKQEKRRGRGFLCSIFPALRSHSALPNPHCSEKKTKEGAAPAPKRSWIDSAASFSVLASRPPGRAPGELTATANVARPGRPRWRKPQEPRTIEKTGEAKGARDSLFDPPSSAKSFGVAQSTLFRGKKQKNARPRRRNGLGLVMPPPSASSPRGLPGRATLDSLWQQSGNRASIGKWRDGTEIKGVV